MVLGYHVDGCGVFMEMRTDVEHDGRNVAASQATLDTTGRGRYASRGVVEEADCVPGGSSHCSHVGIYKAKNPIDQVNAMLCSFCPEFADEHKDLVFQRNGTGR